MSTDAPEFRPRRVVFVSSIGLGPPYHGNRIRLGTLVDAVRDSGAEVSFIGLNLPDAEYAALVPERVQPLANLRWSLAWKLRDRSLGRIARHLRRWLARLTGKPSLNNPLDEGIDPGVVARLAALQARHRFDAAVVVYAVNTLALTAFPKPCLTAIESQDILTDRNATLAGLGIDSAWHSLSRQDEARSLDRADVVLAIQHQEADYFRSICSPGRSIVTIRHLVAPAAIPRAASDDSPDPRLALGVIASDNPINARSVLGFIAEVFRPLAASGLPVKLVLAGSICRLIDDSEPAIVKLGEIRDPVDFYRQIDVTVNPTVGGTGLKIKTIEAIAAGRGVIGGSSAVTGLEDCVGHGIVLASTATEYREAIEALVADSRAAVALGRAAFDSALRVHAESKQALDGLLATIGGGK